MRACRRPAPLRVDGRAHRTGGPRRRAWLLLLGLVVAGCSFDYADARVEVEDAGALPQVELLDVTMRIQRDNRLELSADRIASYPDLGYQEFSALRFREFGPDGELRLEGQADSGRLMLDTENVDLQGTVRFYSTVEEAEIRSEFLSWESADRVLRGPETSPVILQRDDGSRVEGRGLRVDGRRNSLQFERGVEGRFVDEE